MGGWDVTQFAADDFAAIAAAMNSKTETQRIEFGAGEGDLYCHDCDNGGWTAYSTASGRGPIFQVCQKCFNPTDNPSP